MSELEICDEIRGIVRDTERSYTSYEFFLKSTAFSSLALIGAGAAFCSSRILESGSKSLLRGITEGIFITGSIFISVQSIFLISSTILETPLSLHTTTAKITAISLIGPFGGGTVPRITFAALGLTLGVVSVSKKVNVEISLTTISIIVLALIILMIEGLEMFGRGNLLGFLLLHYGYRFYDSFTFYLSGGPLSRLKVFSRGVMLMFPGLVPIGIVPRMKSKLQPVVISFCIVVGSWGLMRVGDMRLDVALNSFLPGIGLGILLSVLIISVDKALTRWATSLLSL